MSEPIPTPRKWWEDFLPTNWRKIVAWLILAALVTLVNWIRGPEAKPIPLPDPFPIFLPMSDSSNIDQETLEELHKRGVEIRCTGWVPPTEEEVRETLKLMRTPRWQDTDAAGFVAGPDDDAPLWRFHEKVTGQPVPPHNQGEIGSCVSFGTALACELSLAAKINGKRGPPQSFAPNLREAIYGGSRINADPRNPMRNGDGSTGSRAARWLQSGTGGLLPVENRGPYSVSRCREWGNRGVPADLIPICKQNPCQTTLVTSADAARQAIQQGYAIFVCSDQGFGKFVGNVRDADGFLRPQGTWMHCMCIAGYQGGKRKGFLVINSWGDSFVGGPTGRFNDLPPGGFWADYSVVDRMLKQGDSYAVADVEGFKKRKIDPSDWIVHTQPVLPLRPGRFFNHAFALAP